MVLSQINTLCCQQSTREDKSKSVKHALYVLRICQKVPVVKSNSEKIELVAIAVY